MRQRATLLEASRQTRTLTLGVLLMFACGGGLVYFAFYQEMELSSVPIVLISTAGFFVTGAWLCLAIRCPNCGARILWQAFSQNAFGNWYLWLIRLTRCPTCGFEASSMLRGKPDPD
jgi:predicted RNA-binding Zn-ribbon protein involved in translation (DUF1610 family)